MRFTKKDTITLVETFGKVYYNPTLTSKNKENLLKVIQKKFPAWTIKDVGEKLDQMYKKYLSCKSGDNKKWEYYGVVDKVVKLANTDYMLQSIETVISEDSDEDHLEDDPKKEVPKETVKKTASMKRCNEETVGTSPKRIKMNNSVTETPNPIQEITCPVANDQSMQQNISESIDQKLADFQNYLKRAEDNFKLQADEFRSIITSMKNDLFVMINNKENDKKISETCIMSKTLLSEQKETNELLSDNQTLLKSILAAQKVYFDMVNKNYDILKKLYDMLKPEGI